MNITLFIKAVGEFLLLSRTKENAKHLLTLIPNEISQNAKKYKVQGDDWALLTFLFEDWAFKLQGNINDNKLDIIIDDIGIAFNQLQEESSKSTDILKTLYLKAMEHLSSTHVRHLTESEIQSLRESKEDEDLDGEVWVDDIWYKYGNNGKVYWKDNREVIGEFVFSFDMKTEFNFWQDYPHKLTTEQKVIFDAENKALADLKRGK